MTQNEFQAWLDGFLTNKETLSGADIDEIKAKMGEVIKPLPQVNPVYPSYPSYPTWPYDQIYYKTNNWQ